jgi:hypothetical protein
MQALITARGRPPAEACYDLGGAKVGRRLFLIRDAGGSQPQHPSLACKVTAPGELR